MGMNKSSEHLGGHAVYVRSRKYAHSFLNYFSRQFLETLHNFPPFIMANGNQPQDKYAPFLLHVPDADGAKWSHKTNKYQIFIAVVNLKLAHILME